MLLERPMALFMTTIGGSLEDALWAATSGMSQWLEQDCGLTPSEIAQVLGTSAQFSISEVADRNVGVATKLNKQALQVLNKKP